jgi:hypothetical protein
MSVPRYYSIFKEEKKAFMDTQIDWWKFGDVVEIGGLLIKEAGQYPNPNPREGS